MKSKIREEFKQKRMNLSDEEIKEKSKFILQTLINSPEYNQAQNILIYVALPHEVQTKELIEKALNTKQVFVPYMRDDQILISKISSTDDLCSVGEHDVIEPCNPQPEEPQMIDTAILPGLAFDEQGNRLGYGSGHFDRFLQDLSCKKIALSFDFQIIQSIPHEPHDILMDLVITEKRSLHAPQKSI